MEIECGVRITKDIFGLIQDGMTLEMKDSLRATMRASLIAQKKAYDASQQGLIEESFGGESSTSSGNASKGVEFYCTLKGMGQKFGAWTETYPKTFEEENTLKSIGRILGVLSTRVSCGVRLKEFVKDLPMPMFEQYIDTALAVFPNQLEHQIKQYHDLDQSETVRLKGFGNLPDGEDGSKGIEVYCSMKSMCG